MTKNCRDTKLGAISSKFCHVLCDVIVFLVSLILFASGSQIRPHILGVLTSSLVVHCKILIDLGRPSQNLDVSGDRTTGNLGPCSGLG